MAGSYNHAVNRRGQLRSPQHMTIATETPGDAYETIEEMYGMIWFLASDRRVGSDAWSPAEWVEQARLNYQDGIKWSPGREGDEPYAETVDDGVLDTIQMYLARLGPGEVDSAQVATDITDALRKRGYLQGVEG